MIGVLWRESHDGNPIQTAGAACCSLRTRSKASLIESFRYRIFRLGVLFYECNGMLHKLCTAQFKFEFEFEFPRIRKHKKVSHGKDYGNFCWFLWHFRWKSFLQQNFAGRKPERFLVKKLHWSYPARIHLSKLIFETLLNLAKFKFQIANKTGECLVAFFIRMSHRSTILLEYANSMIIAG